jgi:thymidylate synthase
MNNMTMRVRDIRRHFRDELRQERFTTDKTGAKTIELIGASFIADEEAIFGTPNEEYINKEILWYNSMSNNINDINKESEPPAAWKYAANEHGEINSNYGLLTMSHQYYDQLGHVADELSTNPDSRRACMIYNRPSIWTEYDKNGMSDFICTNAVSYMIRDDKLLSVVQMRSNDVVYGYKNDYAWQKWMQEEVCTLVNMDRDTLLKSGDIYWQVQNLHVYEKHFNLVK